MQRPVAIDPISPFREPEASLGQISAEFAGLAVVAASDIALVLDSAGVILDVAHNGVELAREGCAAWIGRRWIETVSPETRVKVEELLAARPLEGLPPARQVNHLSPRGADLPVRYTLVPIGDGRKLAVGREMRSFAALQSRLIEAQHATEREYARLRDAEMRYRLLFQMSAEALLIVDAATRRIVEANPAAERLLTAGGGKRLAGRPYTLGFAIEDAPELDRLAARARASGRADGARARLLDGTAVEVSAALFRQEASAFLLIRLGVGAASFNPAADEARATAALIAAAPEGYVATDGEGAIRQANTAFLNLAQLATEEQALGASLDRFLGRPGVDLNVLLSTLRETGAVRLFTTSLRGEFGSVVDVEISAARVEDAGAPVFGFLIRNVEGRGGPRREGALPRSVEQLTELVGRVPLKDLVRETTDVIERLCIEAALELTGDNRASAAEMLGLSRQSLYVKLRRYGLGDLDDGGASDD